MTLAFNGLRQSLVPLAILSAVSGPACGQDAAPVPTPTEARCPEANLLTYENFGAPFMKRYCTRCHSSELRGSQRNGAPLYHDFDMLGTILAVANHVDWYTAAGPASINTLMPPDGDTPTLEERTDLGQWLACEVANAWR